MFAMVGGFNTWLGLSLMYVVAVTWEWPLPLALLLVPLVMAFVGFWTGWLLDEFVYEDFRLDEMARVDPESDLIIGFGILPPRWLSPPWPASATTERQRP